MELFQRVGPVKHCKVLYPVSAMGNSGLELRASETMIQSISERLCPNCKWQIAKVNGKWECCHCMTSPVRRF